MGKTLEGATGKRPKKQREKVGEKKVNRIVRERPNVFISLEVIGEGEKGKVSKVGIIDRDKK